jgi:lysophospholipase L1-like esterase
MAIRRILLLGDSIGFGFADDARYGGWAGRLKVWFEKKDLGENYFYNLSIPGATTEHLLKRADNEIKARTRGLGLVIFAIGTNDASRGPQAVSENLVAMRQYKSNLRRLARLSKKYGAHVAFISPIPVNEKMSLPVSWKKVYYFQEDVKEYAAAMGEVAKELRVPFLNLYTELNKKGADLKKFLPDGVHPSPAGHLKMYRAIQAFLMRRYFKG